ITAHAAAAAGEARGAAMAAAGGVAGEGTIYQVERTQVGDGATVPSSASPAVATSVERAEPADPPVGGIIIERTVYQADLALIENPSALRIRAGTSRNAATAVDTCGAGNAAIADGQIGDADRGG